MAEIKRMRKIRMLITLGIVLKSIQKFYSHVKFFLIVDKVIVITASCFELKLRGLKWKLHTKTNYSNMLVTA